MNYSEDGWLFFNDGGPLAIGTREGLASWHGAPDGGVGGDYGRACAVRDLVGLVPSGNSSLFVFGAVEQVDAARWYVADNQRAAILAGSMGVEETGDTYLLEALNSDAISDWRLLSQSFPVGSDLVVFHPASGASDTEINPFPRFQSPGRVPTSGVGEGLSVGILPGDYDVDWSQAKLHDGSTFFLLRFRGVQGQ